jgi:hypothetical protein
LLQECDSIVVKEEYPVDFESEYFEVAWLRREEGRSKLLIAIQFESGLAGTNIEIEQLGKELLEDLTAKFPL